VGPSEGEKLESSDQTPIDSRVTVKVTHVRGDLGLSVHEHNTSCMVRAAKPFFIPMSHSPLRADMWRHRSPLLEVKSGVVRRVVASELSLAGERGPEPGGGGTCRHRSPPLQGGEGPDKGPAARRVFMLLCGVPSI
jgi:hypothetical protein